MKLIDEVTLFQILADADIEDAARSLVYGGFFNSGQICMSTERVIVQRSVVEPLIAALRKHTAHLKIGDPSDPSTHMSSLFTEGSAEHVVGLLKSAKEQGVEVIMGDVTRKGALVMPHLVIGVKPGMELWERESFGPGECLVLKYLSVASS